jgi:DNA excision repair protein ERCC-8
MNQLLFDRSTGNLSPQAFSRIQTSQLLHAIQSAPRVRFNGGEKEHVAENEAGESVEPSERGPEESKIWAHQAGVNALAIDIEHRMYDREHAHLHNIR